jgi:cytochrome c oxidase subunit 2
MASLSLAGCATLQSTANTHGPAARSIGHLSRTMDIGFVVVAVVMWALLTIALKKRVGSLKEHMPIDVGGGQIWIAIGGFAIPLLVLSVFFFLGLELLSDFPIHGTHGMHDSMNGAAPSSKPDILIVGHQWWREVHYLNGDLDQQFTTANEIHIPAHRPVNIELQSADVMHSFWVPSLHGKVDLVPGHPNFIRIEASEAGEYFGQCAEFCGEQHAHMRLFLIAQEPADFDAWFANQSKPGVQPASAEAMAGQQAFLAGPCANCHIDEIAEPTLKVLEDKFAIKSADVAPRVFMRLTDNWVELSVRFLCKDHDVRGLKDRMSREIIDNLDRAKIGIASGTYEIVGLPPVRVQMEHPNESSQ